VTWKEGTVTLLDMKRSRLADIYSRITLWRGIRAPASRILLLLPRCLQNNQCCAKIPLSIDECERCGQCDLTEIAALKDQYGIQVLIASGGRQAVEAARHPQIKLIVAVACAKELLLGILSVFPKPVITVYNRQSNGPCVNTRVNATLLEETLKKVVQAEPA